MKMNNVLVVLMLKRCFEFKGALCAAFWLLVSFISHSAVAVPLLYDVRYNPMLAGQSEFAFVFDEALVNKPKVNIVNNPPRLEVFFANADFEQNLKAVEIGKSGISGLKTVFADGGVKVTLALDYLKIFEHQLRDNIFTLRLSDSPTKQTPVAKKQAVEYLNKIKAIDFRRGDQGEGRVSIFLEGNASATDVQEQSGEVVVEFFNTDLMDELLYELDVADFATVVSSIETFKNGSNTRVVIRPNGPFTYTHQQIDSIFTIALNKDTKNSNLLGGTKKYSGKPITLNFQDIPVRTAIQIIADYNGFNLVTSDSVSGNVTLRLDGTPWDQALDIVLKVKGLDKRMEGNILMVAPTEELVAREAKELQAKQQVEKLEPLFTEFIQVNYAKAAEIAELLRTEGTSFISERGAISVDQRTNTLLIKDTRSSIENVREAIETLDIPIRQVLIESRMVTVKDNVAEELGE